MAHWLRFSVPYIYDKLRVDAIQHSSEAISQDHGMRPGSFVPVQRKARDWEFPTERAIALSNALIGGHLENPCIHNDEIDGQKVKWKARISNCNDELTARVHVCDQDHQPTKLSVNGYK